MYLTKIILIHARLTKLNLFLDKFIEKLRSYFTVLTVVLSIEASTRHRHTKNKKCK